LNDVVFEDAGFAEGAKDGDGEDGDGDGGGDGETGAETDVDSDRSEEDAEEAAEDEGAGGELGAGFESIWAIGWDELSVVIGSAILQIKVRGRAMRELKNI
jgi:hypothetical protein